MNIVCTDDFLLISFFEVEIDQLQMIVKNRSELGLKSSFCRIDLLFTIFSK